MTDPNPGEWQSCPPGELSRLTARMKFRRRLWTAATVGGIVLVASAALAATVVGVRALLPDSHPTLKKQHQKSSFSTGEHGDGKGPRPASKTLPD